MSKKRRCIGVLASVLILLALTACGKKEFMHVEEDKIVDASGNEVWLKGMALGNEVWENPKVPVRTSHNEESYQDISNMGFNCVRFYINYQLFEDDTEPYTYKESGFDWIDENIRWAKENDVGIILNMHVPQGGYQSQGKGAELWLNEDNQNRLIALWQEIARRYADEETILGYGLINEPIVPKLEDTKQSVEQCQTLMQRITDAIRVYDKNHMIFAERVCALLDVETGSTDWELGVEEAQFLLQDDNTVYEFHCYDPYQFTHQGLDWAGTTGITVYYPSDDIYVSSVITGWVGCTSSWKTSDLDDGWMTYESDYAQYSDQYNIGTVALRADNTGVDGSVLFDDVVVEEYQNETFIREVKSLLFDSGNSSFYYWAADGNGSYSYNETGYTGKCAKIQGTTGDANLSGYQFELRPGYRYKVKAKVKVLSGNPEIAVRIDYQLAEGVRTLDKQYLEDTLLKSMEFGTKYHVPMYLGEFGAANTTFKENRGGDRWVSDMLSICKEYQLHFNYHTYHETGFGLYQNAGNYLPSMKNEALEAVFCGTLMTSKSN